MTLAKLTLSLALLVGVLGDVYLHNPRGSNNRLDETTSNRKQANRLFDSQNNNKGGYNTGDRLNKEAGSRTSRQYSMQYYASGGNSKEDSKLLVEWTNQHGCGESEKNNCNVVIQYMCQSNGTDEDYPSSSRRGEEWVKRDLYMRDGGSTRQQSYAEPSKRESDGSYERRMEKNSKYVVSSSLGLHETVWWYDSCKYREANGGLFTADRDLKTDKIGYSSASKTRQNEDGNRNGYECPEERDYFPYWSPTLQTDKVDHYQRTPWIDAAWLGDSSKCDYITSNSFNQNSKSRCVLSGTRSYSKAIDEDACAGEGGKWVQFTSFLELLKEADTETKCNAAKKNDERNTITWGRVRSDSAEHYCIVQAPALTCRDAPSSRVNHLGNPGSNNDGQSKMPEGSRFEMHLPHFPSGDAKRCILRVRYNISTGDYDPWNTFSTSNDDDDVIENDPEIDVLGNNQKLDIALNTAQTGRTFQDRSHVFVVLPRLSTMADKTIYNLNVRGKRGNLVQTFPAVEYDFIPNDLTVTSADDLVHVQWTGSNSHDNNNDGDAGEGKGGTDRHNMLEASDLTKNYPELLKDAEFWAGVESLTDPEANGEDIAIGLATSGFYCSKEGTKNCPRNWSLSKTRNLDGTLDAAPASYFGHVLKFKKSGSLKYLCSRNNNFSNRSQKGKLIVK